MHIQDAQNTPNGTSNIQRWADLIRFQLSIAETWLERGKKMDDVFAKFFFYFSGFNAIYFLWRKIDNIDQTNEGKHIENLLKKFDEGSAAGILEKIKVSVEFFSNRRPIQRMDRRTGISGDEDEGRKWRKKMQDNASPYSERLVAIGQILYLVRSNLVHGSKTERGDDLQVIEQSVNPLMIFLEKSILLTKHQCLNRRT
jgi:hypothetical protein